MTEDEAKTKACCADLRLGAHIQDDLPQFATCIGSRCMAWRWEKTSNTAINRKHGFCGLAGRPIP